MLIDFLTSFDKTWNNIVAHTPDLDDNSNSNSTAAAPLITFSKDMASYIFPLSPASSHSPAIPSSFGSTGAKSSAINPTLIPTELLLDPSIVHTFLIRHPAKAIPSYKRLCYPGSPTGFNYFDPAEAGYKELRILFDFIRENKPEEKILVMESEELLEDPERVMKGWCETVGIKFDAGMLQWEEGTREHLYVWNSDSLDVVSGALIKFARKLSSPASNGQDGIRPLKIVQESTKD